MSDFFKGLVERIKSNPIELVYSAIIFICTAMVIIITVRIFLSIRRWYKRAKVARQEPDFKETVDYIKAHNKDLTRYQRFILEQTGSIPTKKDTKTTAVMLFIGIASGLILGFIAGNDNPVVLWIFRIATIFGGICCLVEFVDSVKKLIKYGRIPQFLFWLLYLLMSGVSFYIFFILEPIA